MSRTHPQFLDDFRCLYAHAGQWGYAGEEYYHHLNRLFRVIANQYGIPARIPLKHVGAFLDESDRVVVILEQLDYLLKLKGEKSPYGYAAYSLSQLKEPVSEFKGDFKQLKGIGPVTEKLIREIIRTGTCNTYETLISQQSMPGQPPK